MDRPIRSNTASPIAAVTRSGGGVGDEAGNVGLGPLYLVRGREVAKLATSLPIAAVRRLRVQDLVDFLAAGGSSGSLRWKQIA
jgi:hypothetical protein